MFESIKSGRKTIGLPPCVILAGDDRKQRTQVSIMRLSKTNEETVNF